MYGVRSPRMTNVRICLLQVVSLRLIGRLHIPSYRLPETYILNYISLPVLSLCCVYLPSRQGRPTA